MKSIKKEWENIVWCFLIPIAIFVLFKQGIDVGVKKVFVEPLFSSVFPATWRYDVAVFVIFFTILIPIAIKVLKGGKIPNKWYYLFALYTSIYLTYRIRSTLFEFTPFSFNDKVKLWDLIGAIPFIIICCSVLTEIRKNVLKKRALKSEASRNKETLGSSVPEGFAVDEPITIDTNNDLLNRNKFIEEIAEKIRNTETKEGSFPIGIVAKWGAGKTTFINTLFNTFSDDEIIKIKLDVWRCSNSSQIIEVLFKELKVKLKDYSFTINNKLQDYTTSLLKGTKNEGLNSIKNITELIMPNASTEQQYENINKEIKQINKKIIIVIDDLDRLDKKEIYEVIRLIRNTANFANTFFVVAYDRNYILNAIEEINPYQTHYFLEKIFQIEFSLPVISDNTLQKEIWKRIGPFLNDLGKDEYNLLNKRRGLKFLDDGDVDLTTKYIHSIRDVVRFVNSFKLSYKFVKDEVYFPDFYNLELIKFKHPDLFSMIYKEHQKLFTTDSEQAGSHFGSTNTYCLQKVYEDGKETEISELRVFIESNKEVLKLSNKDIDTVCSSFASIFVHSNSGINPSKNTQHYHLTALKPSMFDRYFVLGIEGKLSENTFSKMRQLPYDEFIATIEDLAIVKDLSYELSERFEQIQYFDSKEDFEKIVKGIFHFANLPNPNKESTSLQNWIGYNSEAISKVIGDEKNITLFDNKEEYKAFILDILESKSEKYLYPDEFIKHLLLLKYPFVKDLFNKGEINDLAIANFKNSLNKHNKLSYDLWYHFKNCTTHYKSELVDNHRNIKYKESKSLMRKFIFEKDIDTFLQFAVESALSNHDTVPFGGVIKSTFKTTELFIWLLERYKGQSIYKEEFLQFYEALTTNHDYVINGVPVSFFKVIPVFSQTDKV